MSTETQNAPNQTAPSGGAASTETEPERLPEQATGTVTAERVGPALLPPSQAGADAALAQAATATTSTWQANVMVTATWSINQDRNAWVYVQNVGWNKIFNGSDGAFLALIALATQAKETKRPITIRTEADGMIHEIYLW
jgi:hypothetical protein